MIDIPASPVVRDHYADLQRQLAAADADLRIQRRRADALERERDDYREILERALDVLGPKPCPECGGSGTVLAECVMPWADAQGNQAEDIREDRCDACLGFGRVLP